MCFIIIHDSVLYRIVSTPHPPTPSFRWLLHYRDMQVRTTHREYMNAVEQYFRQLFEVLIPLQSAYGGPIIAFQLENEYGAVSVDDDMGKDYMTFLFQVRTCVV